MVGSSQGADLVVQGPQGEGTVPARPQAAAARLGRRQQLLTPPLPPIVLAEHAKLEWRGGRLYCTALAGDPDDLLAPTAAWIDGSELRPGVQYLVPPNAVLRFGEFGKGAPAALRCTVWVWVWVWVCVGGGGACGRPGGAACTHAGSLERGGDGRSNRSSSAPVPLARGDPAPGSRAWAQARRPAAQLGTRWSLRSARGATLWRACCSRGWPAALARKCRTGCERGSSRLLAENGYWTAHGASLLIACLPPCAWAAEWKQSEAQEMELFFT
jgi:hypothetical protein